MKNLRIVIKKIFEEDDEEENYFIDLLSGNSIGFEPDLGEAIELIFGDYKKYFRVKYLDSEDIPNYDDGYHDDDEALEKFLKRKTFLKYSAIFLNINQDSLMFILFTPEMENIIKNTLGFNLNLIYKSIQSSVLKRVK